MAWRQLRIEKMEGVSMNQTLQKFTRVLRRLEYRQQLIARRLDTAERHDDVSTSMLLEQQYRDVVQTMGRLRRVLRRLQPDR
jgi:hypothetical protein